MKLTPIEQETVLLYNQAETTADVETYDPKLLEKLNRLADKYPEQIQKTGERRFLGTIQRRAPQGGQRTGQGCRV